MEEPKEILQHKERNVKRLSKTSKKILLELARSSQMSHTLAKRLNLPPNNLRARLNKLEKCGYVEKESIFWKLTSVGKVVFEIIK